MAVSIYKPLKKQFNNFIVIDDLSNVDDKTLWPYIYVKKNLFYVSYITFIYGLEYNKKKEKFMVTKQRLEVLVSKIFLTSNSNFRSLDIGFYHSKHKKEKSPYIGFTMDQQNVKNFLKKPIGKIPNKKDFLSLGYKNLIDDYVKFMLIDRVYKYFYKTNLKSVVMSTDKHYTYSYYENLLKIRKRNKISDLVCDNVYKFEASLQHNIDVAREMVIDCYYT